MFTFPLPNWSFRKN